MNKVEFQQTGGFPLETDTLDFLQAGLATIQALTALGGDNYIVSGCVVAGANTSDGYVVINSELLPFRGGLNQTKVVVREIVTPRSFQNGTSKAVFKDRYATFGTGTEFILFADLLRIKDLITFRKLPHEASSAINSNSETTLATSKAVKIVYDALNNQVPVGFIGIWSGAIADIPVGWALCDGIDGRPNLINAFVLGAGGSYAVGSVGGEAEHQLSISELPKFKPKFRHGKSKRGTTGTEELIDKFSNNFITEGDEIGGDQAHNNMPPYYALAYIIKL